jgi:photosystem II stability/assembly factor-like uncharacterized protein
MDISLKSSARAVCVTVTLLLLAGTAGAQVTIDSYTFGAIRARHIGPAAMSGRIMAIDAVVDDPRIIFVGAASGGVWKTINGGTGFDPIFDDYSQSIGAIAIDQAHPDTVWIGTGEGCPRNSVSIGTGIYRTTDGGENWKLMGLENSERIPDIVVHPSNSEIVYVAVLGHLWDANKDRGVYKTTDGGTTWERVLYIDENTGCADLAINPQNPDVLYAAMWEYRRSPDFFTSGGKGSGLYKTTDGGAHWTRLTEGLPEGELGRIAVAVAPSNPKYVYATVESEKTALYRSEDAGATWTRFSTSFNVQARPFYFSHLTVDPLDSLRVYKPGYSLTVSRDGGDAFGSVFLGGGNVHPDMHAFWIDPNDTKHMLVGTDGGLYQSRNRGNSWNFMHNLPVSQFYRISVDMEMPYNVYGGLQDNGCWVGPSRSPAGIQSKDWQPVGFGDGFCVIPDPVDLDIIYWEYQGGEINRYHKSSGEVKSIKPYPEEGQPKLRFNWNTPMVLSPNIPGALYVGSQYLYRTTDKGESWERLSDDLTTDDPEKQRQEESGGITIDNSTAENHCTIFTICESPLDGNIIWAGTDDGNLQVTRDGGKKWTNVVGKIKNLPKNTWCSCVEAGHYDPGTAYVTFDGHRTGDKSPHIYKTTDYGKNWVPLVTDSIEGYAHVIREDLVNPNLLFVGTEFGLFVSVDGGTQWARFTGNMPKVSVRDMVIHPRESDLVIGTHGRGVLILDDLTPLREITPDVLESDITMLSTRPTPSVIPQFEQAWDGDEQFVGQNPSSVALITYYMKKRHMFGDLHLEIYDSTGTLLKSLPGGKRRGINRVAWYMRRKPPKVAPAPTLAGGAIFGPMLPEGTYTVNVIRGADTASGEVRVVPDPASPHSPADRALQQETVLKLYDMQGNLAFIGESVTGARDQARERADSLPDGDDLAERLNAFADRLDELNKTLVATRPGFITGEEQLRERVVGLYSTVSRYGGRPTQSQLDRLGVLQGQIGEAEADFETILGEDLTGLNAALQERNLTPITRLTRAEFDAKNQ